MKNEERATIAHSPLPFKVHEGDDYLSIHDADGNDLWVYRYPDDHEREDAEFIVRAVNSHDALVDALELFVKRLDVHVDLGHAKPSADLIAARTALALARVEAVKP